MSSTVCFDLPLLSAGQAQKEVTVNEAMTLIDALIQPCVESVGTDVPPLDPVPGQCWIIGSAPTGEWTGAAQMLAIWTVNGWRFAQCREGMAVHVRSNGLTACYADGEWRTGILAASELRIADEQVVGSRQPAVTDPSGGAVVDTEARLAIVALLDALRAHGLIAA
jgi:hypothetical protein